MSHLKMLRFKSVPHASTIYAFKRNFKDYIVQVIISKNNLRINKIHLHISNHKEVRTGHTQGLNYLVKLIEELKE